MPPTIHDKLQRAADDELVLRDEEGVIFRVIASDTYGAYIHSTNSDPHRVRVEKIDEMFEFVDADREAV